MFLSIDLGGSTVDLILFTKNKIIKIISIEASELKSKTIKNILAGTKISPNTVQHIILTGGYNEKFGTHYKNTIPITKVNEIKAIGAGGLYLAKKKRGLVLSLGTGTCMVSAEVGKYKHIGGTGMGGGALYGLSQLLLNEKDVLKTEEYARQGKIENIDLSVFDIVGGGIGIIPGYATASNFGKIQIAKGEKPKKEDLAIGICNIIGQTIATISQFAARTYRHKNIILTGKLIRMKQIIAIINKTAKLYNQKIIVPKNGEYAAAIGAMKLFICKL